jgi:hypothetical protein
MNPNARTNQPVGFWIVKRDYMKVELLDCEKGLYEIGVAKKVQTH